MSDRPLNEKQIEDQKDSDERIKNMLDTMGVKIIESYEEYLEYLGLKVL